MSEYLDVVGLKYFYGRLETLFQKQETGKGLSTNDLTGDLKKTYDDAVSQISSVAAKYIAAVQVNGTDLTADSNKKVNITVPTKVSALTNDSGYQTAPQVNSAIATAVGKITGISFEIVTALPSSGATGVIYLIAHSHSDSNDSYDEYIWIASESKFEKIGNTDVDLSGYLKTTDVSAITTAEIDTMFA